MDLDVDDELQFKPKLDLGQSEGREPAILQVAGWSLLLREQSHFLSQQSS